MKKKLSLKKEVIASLEDKQMSQIKGGAWTDYPDCDTEKTNCAGNTCTTWTYPEICGGTDKCGAEPGLSGVCAASLNTYSGIPGPTTKLIIC